MATYSQVQELVRQLPTTKLLTAYNFLLELMDKKVETLSPQLEFMQHPTHKRYQLLTQQAEQMVTHYKKKQL
ncbi:hypothetical protein [Candidatus Parabeggiatoa sp. HSG14]|uniref:hypothetical protein n=1 Tax=Candidatus Parabeggiatoa sp. HSG14 TaxID=3055593 RepID=UPI0025A72FDF|nr:hypothetical protein [Thiotrichales bacterium HSG14]